MEQTTSETPQTQNIPMNDDSLVDDLAERKPNGHKGEIIEAVSHLLGLIDQETLFHFQQGFKQGAAGLAYLLRQGQSLEDALATCNQDMPHIVM